MPLLLAGRNCWRVAEAGRFALLIDGSNYYEALAESISRAEASVALIGWDVDSRVRLIRNSDRTEIPSSLGDLLRAVVSRNPRMEAYILDWRYPIVLAHEREPDPTFGRDPFHHPRIHFHLDGTHSLGASHHQKIVIIDGKVAFAGGMDVAQCRWDTPEHRANDYRRADGARPYSPAHDVHAMVDGEAARALAEIVEDRWLRATGSRLRWGHNRRDVWPPHVRPDTTNVSIGISRTLPATPDRAECHEVEQLHIDLIENAREFIYVENQYLTSQVVVNALCRRLQEPGGPEMVMVLSLKNYGWMEEHTIEVLRFRCIQRLSAADKYDRLRICYPVVPGLGSRWINVHSKVLVTDDLVFRIGSSNLTNRSMAVDTECDLSIEATDDRLRAMITTLRNRLIGEHLGMHEDAVADFLKENRSLVRLVDSRVHTDRCLRKLLPDRSDDGLIIDEEFVDPSRPLTSDFIIEALAPPEIRSTAHRKLPWLSLLFVIAIALFAASSWRPPAVEELRGDDMAPFLVIGSFVAASLLLVPVMPMILATVAVFGAWPGMLYALSGAMAAALATFGMGWAIGQQTVQKFAGGRLRRVMDNFTNRGVLAVAIVRFLPIAPFTIVNIILGAVHVRLRDFVLGSLIGLSPGIIVISLFEYQIQEVIRNPHGANLFLLAALSLAVVMMFVWLRRRLHRAVT